MRISRQRSSAAILFLAVSLACSADRASGPTAQLGQSSSVFAALQTGDIVVTNFADVVIIDVQTGQVRLAGCCFAKATGVAIDQSGMIIVADRIAASITRVDPATGSKTLISAAGSLSQPHGLAITASGDILVADAESCCGTGTGKVVRVNAVTGIQTVVSSGGSFVDPVGLDIEANGSIVVADFNARKLFRINPFTGAQSVISTILPNGEPYDVVVGADGSLFAVDLNAAALLRIDAASGTRTTVAAQGYLDQPVGVAIEPAGTLLVTDFTANVVVRIDPATGSQSIVANGAPALANPWGIAVWTGTPTLTATIDIKPGNATNVINPRAHGRISVAVLGSANLDATKIKVTSVRFGATGTEASAAHFGFDDVSGDGKLDLVLQFNTADTSIQCGAASARLSGKTLAGQAFQGSDLIRTTGCP